MSILSDTDSIYIINQVNTLTSQSKENTLLSKIKSIFNTEKAFYITVGILLFLIIIFISFRKKIIRYFKIRKIKKQIKSFNEEFSCCLKNTLKKQSERIRKSYYCGKDLWKISQKPYSSSTTMEISSFNKDKEMIDILLKSDKSIYSGSNLPIETTDLNKLQLRANIISKDKINQILDGKSNLEGWFSLEWFNIYNLLEYEWHNQNMLFLLLLIPFILVFKKIISKNATFEVSIPKKELSNFKYSFLRFLPNLLFITSLILLIISLSRPQKSNERIERWSEGIDIMLVVDISESMQIEDFTPNRLESAKSVAKDFIDGRFQDRIGLVVFSGESYSRCPLTSDYSLLKKYIDEINFDLISSRGTAIGSAIAIATNRMRESISKTKILILLSDGDNTAGNIDPKTASEIAKAYGIKIYSIAIGKNGKVPFGKDYFGRPRYVENSLDEKNLRDIAKTTDGKFYRASNNSSLKNIFNEIDEFEKSEIKENRFKNTVDFYQYYLLWGIIFLLTFILSKSTFVSNIIKD